MLFKTEHIMLIKTGRKTATRRLWKKPHAKPGTMYCAQERMFQQKKECLVFIRATNVYQQRLGDMTENDAKKEGGYTLQEFKKTFENITKKKWDNNQVVWVVEFKREKKGKGVIKR